MDITVRISKEATYIDEDGGVHSAFQENLVLILAEIDYSTKWTVDACAVYFWARVAHLIVYTMGLPVFRTLAFTFGFLAQAVLALAIFGLV